MQTTKGWHNLSSILNAVKLPVPSQLMWHFWNIGTSRQDEANAMCLHRPSGPNPSWDTGNTGSDQ